MTALDPLPRTRFIEFRGRKILLLDFSEIRDPGLAVAAIAEARAMVARQVPDGSLLTLTCVGNSQFDSGVLKAIRDLAEHNKPFVRAGAVVGLAGLMKVVYSTLIHLTGRNLRAFDDMEAAKAYLIEQ